MTTLAGVRASDPIFEKMVIGALPMAKDFVTRQFLTPVTVEPALASGKIYVEDTGSFLGDPTVGLERAPGQDMAAVSVGNPTTVDYSLKSYAATTVPIPIEHYERSQIGDLQERGANAVANALAVDEDIELSRLLLGSGWTGDTVALPALPGGTGLRWDEAAGKPVYELMLLKHLIRRKSGGRNPNALLIGAPVAEVMVNNAEVRGFHLVASAGGTALAHGGGQSQFLTEPELIALLRAKLGIPNIVIGQSMKRTSNPAATLTVGDIFGNGVWMGHVDNNAEQASVSGRPLKPTAIAMMVGKKARANIEWNWRNQSYTPWAVLERHMLLTNANLGYQVTELYT